MLSLKLLLIQFCFPFPLKNQLNASTYDLKVFHSGVIKKKFDILTLF